MWNDVEDRTSASLLAKLRETDDRPSWNGAWDGFYAHYMPMVLTWCARWRLQEADADEVASSVLLALGRRMQSFDYDPTHRFRGWLKTVVENEIRSFLSRRTRRPGEQGSGQNENDLLASVSDPSDAAGELAEELDRQRVVLRQAMEQVRSRVKAETWTAFERTALRDEEASVVAKDLGMSVVAVYKAKSRMLEQLREYAEHIRHDG